MGHGAGMPFSCDTVRSKTDTLNSEEWSTVLEDVLTRLDTVRIVSKQIHYGYEADVTSDHTGVSSTNPTTLTSATTTTRLTTARPIKSRLHHIEQGECAGTHHISTASAILSSRRTHTRRT